MSLLSHQSFVYYFLSFCFWAFVCLFVFNFGAWIYSIMLSHLQLNIVHCMILGLWNCFVSLHYFKVYVTLYLIYVYILFKL